MSRVLVLSRTEIRQLLTLETLVPELQRAFVAFADGRTLAYPVVREPLEEQRGIFGIKSGLLKDERVLGLKAGGFWLDNPKRGLTAHQSTAVLFDPATGEPTAFMDGNHITTVRTAAVGVLAARAFARPDSRVAAVLGCGVQGTGQAEALCHALPIAEVRAFDVSAQNLVCFTEALGARPGVVVTPCASAEQAVAGADVVVTAAGGREPVLRADWVRPGMHVSAFGTDTRGKIEVETDLFDRATLFVDDVAQAVTIGETQHAVARRIVNPDTLRATLGEVLAGRHPGRTRPDEITLFDATGLAFQDLVAARLAMDLARERNLGHWISLD